MGKVTGFMEYTRELPERRPAADESLHLPLISRHAELTASPRARWVLENWEQMAVETIRSAAAMSLPLQQPRAIEVARG